MKKYIILLLLIVIGRSYGQSLSIGPVGVEGEALFSYNIGNINKPETKNAVRWTLFPNFKIPLNYRVSNIVSINSGIQSRNLGIIFKDTLSHKIRSLTIGIPLGVKLLMNRTRYLVVGGLYERLYHTKEKTFFEDRKTKESSFFSKKAAKYLPSFYLRYGFTNDISVQISYYPENFLNNNYEDLNSNTTSALRPYKESDSKIVAISLVYSFLSSATSEHE